MLPAQVGGERLQRPRPISPRVDSKLGEVPIHPGTRRGLQHWPPGNEATQTPAEGSGGGTLNRLGLSPFPPLRGRGAARGGADPRLPPFSSPALQPAFTTDLSLSLFLLAADWSCLRSDLRSSFCTPSSIFHALLGERQTAKVETLRDSSPTTKSPAWPLEIGSPFPGCPHKPEFLSQPGGISTPKPAIWRRHLPPKKRTSSGAGKKRGGKCGGCCLRPTSHFGPQEVWARPELPPYPPPSQPFPSGPTCLSPRVSSVTVGLTSEDPSRCSGPCSLPLLPKAGPCITE